MAAKKWNGQDVAVEEAAEAQSAVSIKRRPCYIYAGFDTSNHRTSFKAALGSIPNITFADIVHPDEPDLFFVKVEPA